MSGAWCLAGLVVARRGPALADDPVAALCARATPSTQPAALVIDVEAVAGPAKDPGGTPLCFHGGAKVRALDDDEGGILVVHDGSTRIDVRRDGLRLTTPADPAARAPGVVEVTLMLGVILALRAHGRFHLHGGLLARGDDGVLVVGTSGAGKTTTCLALEQAGFRLLGDDVAFLGDAGRAWALPRDLHVGAMTAQAFPGLSSRLGVTLSSGKRALPPPTSSASPSGAVSVRRILLPTITTQTTTTTETPTQAEVLGALIEAGAFVVVDGLVGADTQLARLAALASLPATALHIGRDALDDGGVIARALLEAP